MTTLARPAAAIIALLALGAMVFAPSPQRTAAATTTVPVGDYWFCNSTFEGSLCETTVTVGDTVVWDFSGSTVQHTSTACGSSCSSPASAPAWDSGTMTGGTFQFTFAQAGTYLYHCELHPDLMQGRIVVQGAAPTGTAPVGATPVATTTGALPVSGQGPPSSSTDWWLLAALAAFGIGSTTLGVLALVRRAR